MVLNSTVYVLHTDFIMIDYFLENQLNLTNIGELILEY